MMSERPTLPVVLRDQAPFLAVAVMGSAGLLLVPGWGGSTGTWALIGLLWLGGAVDAARRSAGADRAWLTARVGVQNVIIQLCVALPAIAAGLIRLSRDPEARFGAAFLSNALVTLVALPALSAVILTCAALVVAVPLHMVWSRSARSTGMLLLALLLGLWLALVDGG